MTNEHRAGGSTERHARTVRLLLRTCVIRDSEHINLTKIQERPSTCFINHIKTINIVTRVGQPLY